MSGTLDRLGSLGAEYHDPVAAIDWDKASPDLPWLPAELLSLPALGDGAPGSLDELARLSRIEFARLCAAGLWLEGILISRVTVQGFPAVRADEARVMLQEVREESGHGLMFLEMIRRAHVPDIRLLGPTGLLSWIARRLGPDSPAFWAMVFVGESVTDSFAVRALRAADAGSPICPVARQVLALHHRDEARHIAAARTFLETRIAKMGRTRRLLFAATFRFLLKRFLRATLYPTASSLNAIGIVDAKKAARAVRDCPDRARLARDCAASAVALLSRRGLTAPAPAQGGAG